MNENSSSTTLQVQKSSTNITFTPKEEAVKGMIHAIWNSHVRQNACFTPTPEVRGFLRQMWLERACQSIETDNNNEIAGSAAGSVVLVAESWFDRLWDMHTEQWRHYHTAVHLKEMMDYLNLILLSEKETLVVSSSSSSSFLVSEDQVRAILLAIFFHDCIYRAESNTNEEDSVDIFETFAKEIGLVRSKPDLCTNVATFIRATIQHKLSNNNDNDDDGPLLLDLNLFLDLDMAVLGKTPVAYESYAALIRKEYHFVPRDIYCTKRAEILETFLQQPRIFGTTVMRQALEEVARTNLQKEISSLRNGIIYGE